MGEPGRLARAIDNIIDNAISFSPADGLIEVAAIEADSRETDALRARLGVDGLVELTATAGYYGMLACTLNAFDVTPEAGAEVLNVP